MSQIQTQEYHTLVHVVCDECDEPNTVTLLEHPKDSKQSAIVIDAHHQVAEDHADANGHHVEVGVSEDDPDTVASFAESLRRDLLGEEFVRGEQ